MGMKKAYRIKCNKYRQFKIPKISCIFKKVLIHSVICDKHCCNYEKIFKQEESIKILKYVSLDINMN